MDPQELPGREKKELDSAAARIACLIAGFLRGTLTPPEHEELDRWVEASDRNMLLFEELTAQADTYPPLRETDGLLPCRKVRRHRAILRYALPAAAVVLLAVGGWWLFRIARPATTPFAAAGGPLQDSSLPGQPLLILGDGTAIAVPLHRDTSLRVEGGRLQVGSAGLVYRKREAPSAPAARHTLRTPRQQTLRVALEDGTRVWLNGGTRLSYPSQFGVGTREVALEGEAWFEVAPDPARPFLVRTRGLSLRVLGTAFNVEAYSKTVATTLIEGRLQVQGAGDSAVLTAGEQLRAAAGGRWHKLREADVASALDWQSGVFVFRGASLETILHQLARWYGVEVIRKDSCTHHFSATLPRHLPLERVLAILELTGRVRFRLKGQTLIVEDPPATFQS